MKIRNINGIYQKKCACGSWLAHWENFSNLSAPTYCPAYDCQNKGLVGVHVQKGGLSPDQKWYIYPLCGEHSRHSGELEVSSIYPLISADKKDTYDR